MTPRRKAQVSRHVNQAAMVCVDDYGEEVWLCPYTGKLVWISKAFLVGAILPQCDSIYVCADGYLPFYKESRRLFNESERNCNTCKFLIRVPFKNDNSGLQPGKCSKPNNDLSSHPYFHGKSSEPLSEAALRLFELITADGSDFYFAPDDCMNMTCYEQRA